MYDSDSHITLKQRFTPNRLLANKMNSSSTGCTATPSCIDTRIREPGLNMINKRPPIERINSPDLLIFLAAQRHRLPPYSNGHDGERSAVAMHRFFHFMHGPIDLCLFATLPKQKFNYSLIAHCDDIKRKWKIWANGRGKVTLCSLKWRRQS